MTLFIVLFIDFRDMRNSFNLLLIALSLFDTCYLAGAILESMRKSFGVHSEWQTLLFPGRHAHTNANQFISKEAGFFQGFLLEMKSTKSSGFSFHLPSIFETVFASSGGHHLWLVPSGNRSRKFGMV